MSHSRGWTISTIDMQRAVYSFSPGTVNEVKNYMAKFERPKYIDEIKVNKNELVKLSNEVAAFKEEVEEGQKFIILESIAGLTFEEIETFHWIVSNLLGETIVQNEEGRHLIHIFDRDPNKTIKDGMRYHQTHETGAIHTDNVNIPENYEYLIVGCVEPAMIGGENVIINGQAIYDYLRENASEELKILMSDFCWEYRGISKELFNAPIITLDKRERPHFRHLRTYMESAHKRAGKPLTPTQVRAVDALDATLNMSQFQLTHRLKAGQILVANDSQVLHDRKCFFDKVNSISIDEKKSGKKGSLRRSLLRTWVRRCGQDGIYRSDPPNKG